MITVEGCFLNSLFAEAEWVHRTDIKERVWEVHEKSATEKRVIVFDEGNDEYSIIATEGFNPDAFAAAVLRHIECGHE